MAAATVVVGGAGEGKHGREKGNRRERKEGGKVGRGIVAGRRGEGKGEGESGRRGGGRGKLEEREGVGRKWEVGRRGGGSWDEGRGKLGGGRISYLMQFTLILVSSTRRLVGTTQLL